jgi:hypothetical protein
MNRIQFILLFTLFFFITDTLRLNTQHLVYDNSADYLQGLINQQSQFEAQIAVLKKDVNNTVGNATNTTDI